jgi:hypothetical protein
VIIARLDITIGLPKRDLPTQCDLQMASGETQVVMKEAFIRLTLAWCPLTTWMFVACIADEVILGLDVMHSHDASMYL